MFGALAFLIICVGAIVFAIEALYGHIQGNSLSAMAILMGVASSLLLFKSSVRQGLASGVAPYDSEGLTFDTKFDELKLQGRVSGTITGA